MSHPGEKSHENRFFFISFHGSFRSIQHPAGDCASALALLPVPVYFHCRVKFHPDPLFITDDITQHPHSMAVSHPMSMWRSFAGAPKNSIPSERTTTSTTLKKEAQKTLMFVLDLPLFNFCAPPLSVVIAGNTVTIEFLSKISIIFHCFWSANSVWISPSLGEVLWQWSRPVMKGKSAASEEGGESFYSALRAWLNCSGTFGPDTSALTLQ